MPRHQKSTEQNRRYHDRVASRYDSIYDDPYWEFHDRITWNHIKPHLPRTPGAPVMDLGTGTGKWGLKLLKAGYTTTFSDLSNNMLQEVRKKLEEWSATPDLAAKAARAAIQQADATDLHVFPENHFELIIAMGDVVSICSDPARALSEMHRLLKPGGIAIFTVDNALAAIDFFIESGNLPAMAAFVRTGKTEWLTKNVDERFPVHMFTPSEIDSLVRARGFEIISRIGKTAIAARRNKKLFEEDRAIETLVEIETSLQKEPASLGRASHIQLAVRKV
ncbi:MAG TPA: methyltransferase domain-containing protein [Phycisphaerae bacterium]|jgi:ubiquinone/menaquinone biosynthesis C-methylase UbiE|nr:methyltransferase domain-containing protein [Phycisphaerae bacterium]